MVASVQQATSSDYITVDASNTTCTLLSNVSTTTEAAQGISEDPAGFDYEAGLVNFTLTGCSTAEVEIYFYGLSQAPDQIRKCGLLQDRTTRGWYSMPGVAVRTETVAGETVYIATYTLTDGQPGDDDTVANSITDPVGAGVRVGGVVPGSGIPTSIPTPDLVNFKH